MEKSQKAVVVDTLKSALEGAPMVVLADFRGSSVEESNALRRALEAQDLNFTVVKNTLARRAIADTEFEGLGELLDGMTAMVISGDDPVATARLLKDSLDPKKGHITLKGGILEGQVLDAKTIASVADMPSREEQLATVLRTILAGPQKTLGVLQAPGRDLMILLKNYETKLAENPGNE